MKIIPNENIVVYDVDGTLILEQNNAEGTLEEIKLDYIDLEYTRYIHHKHVELLIHQKERGFHIHVWSNAGYKWAADVIHALEIEEYVDSVSTKPICFIEDQPQINSVLGRHVFLKP